jgi:uncharacterized membrane protein (DUF485 family)
MQIENLEIQQNTNSKDIEKMNKMYTYDSNSDPNDIDKVYSRSGTNSNSDKKHARKKLLKKKKKYYHMSMKYTVYLFTFWFIFLASFIVGFIIHYQVKTALNASTIIWSFSGFIFVISLIYTIIYYKAKKAKTPEELEKYLKFLPL